MNNTDYLGLYKTYLKGFKQLSGYQFVALCPFHEDTEQSFSGEHHTGQYNCKACGEKGNAVTFAKAINLPNPKQYATKSNGSTTTTNIYPDWDSIPALDIQVDLDMEKHKTKLKNNIDKYPKIWDKVLIDELGIGLDYKNNWVFGYYDALGNLMGMKTHKKATTKGLKSHWYPQNKIGSYSREKPLYICEGEKDAITLISHQYQAISGSAGALCIPKDKEGNYDLELFQDYVEIYIVYDNDKGGRKGAKNLADKILEKYPHLKVNILQWNKNLPDKFDVTDAFELDNEASEFYNALADSITIEIKQERKGFKMYKLSEFLEQEYVETIPIIENILYKGQTSIIAGEQGSKKSWIALQSTLALASGLPLFHYFKTTPQKVMLVQFENENYDCKSRYNLMLKDHIDRAGNSDWLSNVITMELEDDNKDFDDNWKRIEHTLIEHKFRNAVLIVDNLYKSTDVDLHDNNACKGLLGFINRVRRKYNLSIILICHCNKNATAFDKELRIGQIQGGAVLCGDIANVSMVGNSMTSNDLNIFKIVKAGRSSKNELHNRAFKLHWSDDTCNFKKGAIVLNEALHFQSMKSCWEIELIKWIAGMPEMKHSTYFDRDIFRRSLPDDKKDWCKTTETRYLNKMCDWGIITKLQTNKYQLRRNVIEDFTSDK